MSNEFKLVPVALLEHIESLKKQLQESVAQTAPLQAEIERLKETVEDSTQIILQQGDSVKQLKALLVLANAALEGRIDAALSQPADKQGAPAGWAHENGLKELQERKSGTWPFITSLSSHKSPVDGVTVALYRHAQPATAKVVLPEHQDSDLRSPVYGYARGWNACIDEVKKLNNQPS